jgi:hypothetical protein
VAYLQQTLGSDMEKNESNICSIEVNSMHSEHLLSFLSGGFLGTMDQEIWRDYYTTMGRPNHKPRKVEEKLVFPWH